MSSKFDGFSPDEINKINAKPKKEGLFAAKSLGVGRGIRRVQEANSINERNNKNNENDKKVVKTTSAGNKLLNPSVEFKKMSDESLTKLHEAVHFQTLSTKNEPNTNDRNCSKTNETDESDESILHLSKNENENSNSSEIIQNSEKFQNENQLSQMSPFRGISLKDFEAQRKIREEQNKIKKDILYKAIEKHTQKTAAEVKKIEEIKNELSKLDQDLAADVAILRKQIETACIHYSNIEKHYNKVEQMFLKAKLDLHHASEKKELLTEHLCTVITHNEDRKAKKLSELLEKVGLSPTCATHLDSNDGIRCLENNTEIIDQ